MKKINYTLTLAFMALSTLFTACQRNGDMPDRTDANSTVDHLIFKEVFYIGYCTYRDLSSCLLYTSIYRFSPSWSVIEYSTTMASADFSRQALLRFFRKNNYLKRP